MPCGTGATWGVAETSSLISPSPLALTALTAYQYCLPPISIGPSVHVIVSKPGSPVTSVATSVVGSA